MHQQSHAIIVLAHQDVRRCKAHLADVLLVERGQQFQHVVDGRIEEVLAGHHGRIVVEQLLQRLVVARLHGHGIDAFAPLFTRIGRKVELMLVADSHRSLTVLPHAVGKLDVISQLIVELHEVAVLFIYQPLVEVAEWHTHLIGLTGVAGLYQFFEIHLTMFDLRFIPICVQKYTNNSEKSHRLHRLTQNYVKFP